ncbi:MAG: maleylpyruvate isomerase family mycothiol-dependent enzyme [Ilumatobacter sp.]|uniref:maleylpyruvate isomerase family mycothiol-dependent enzyme n=1 Tax=Ilumatobacter sp. TaxID=1967498 RepID=UPI00391B97F8
MNHDSYISALRSDARRLAACATIDLDAPVPSCPDWTVRTLIEHTGGVHRWAANAIETATAPTTRPAGPGADATSTEIETWLVEGADRLADLLATSGSDEATWHPFGLEPKTWVWARRQAHETLVHRWDGETAVGIEATIDPIHAADAIHEYWELGAPRILARSDASVPEASLHIHCTDDALPDGAGEWLVWNEHGEYRMEPVHRKGDAALRGPAEQILLTLMGRSSRDGLDIVGDQAAADAWLSIDGW